MVSRKRVICKKCRKEKWITSNDVKTEDLPIDIPFTSPVRYYYNCEYCGTSNGIWPDKVPN